MKIFCELSLAIIQLIIISKTKTLLKLFDILQGIQNDFTVKDASGKCLMAKTVFSLSIRYFKDDLIDMMSEKQILVGDLTENVIMWVLTVPAIWNDTAKQFMREAAENVRLIILYSFEYIHINFLI
jgi:hypothetical protein